MPDSRGTADSHNTAYRPFIDGLRAVAVLSVIAFHFSNNALRGGYLGVDIFFVISGYLITTVIWREAGEGKFSIARFYERRIRRIMPALLVVLGVVSALAIALLLPIDLRSYAKSVFATLAFFANVYFWRDTDYFSRLAEEKPLLHCWSLGVEEQFYILFPLLVILCVRWRRKAMLPVTIVLVVLSLIADIVLLRSKGANVAFFLLPTRAWEIGMGSIIALIPARRIEYASVRHGLATMAAALLLFGLFTNATFLGASVPPAVVVVAGAALAIYLGDAGTGWIHQVLSLRIMVWIGLISYSLYLWHWPLIVFARYYLVSSQLSIVEVTFVLALAFIMATLSWRFIERPFRNRSMAIGSVLLRVGTGFGVVALTSVLIIAAHGFPSRFDPSIARINAAVGTEYHCDLSKFVSFGASRGCLMAIPSGQPADARVALLGNSHAQMYAPLVLNALRANHLGGILIPLNACLPTPDFNVEPECMPLAARNLAALEELPQVRVVILSMTWNFSREAYTTAGPVPEATALSHLQDSVDRLVDDLQQHGKTVVLVGPICVPGDEKASIVGRELAFHHRVDEPLFAPEQSFLSDKGSLIAHFEARKDLIFIRPDLIQCQAGRCDFFRDGAALFADSSHVAMGALPLFAPAFDPALQRAFSMAAQRDSSFAVLKASVSN